MIKIYCRIFKTCLKALKYRWKLEPIIMANHTETNAANQFGPKFNSFAKDAFKQNITNTTKKCCRIITVNSTVKEEVQFSFHVATYTWMIQCC